jgi:hypothetical protein
MAYQRISPNLEHLVRTIATSYPDLWEAARERADGSRDKAFIKRLAWELNQVDSNVGLNGKRGTDDISADALAYKNASAPGGAEVIDVIVGSTHTPSWQDATLPPCPHPKCDPAVPNGVLGKFIMPLNPDTGQPPASETHRYRGGGNDTGNCDDCGQRWDSDVHRIPEGFKPHAYDGGEDGAGRCEICLKEDPNDPIHHSGENGEEPGLPVDLEQLIADFERRLQRLEQGTNDGGISAAELENFVMQAIKSITVTADVKPNAFHDHGITVTLTYNGVEVKKVMTAAKMVKDSE